MIVELKTCKKCGQQKPIDRFTVFTLRSGLKSPRGDCWECRGEYAHENFDRLADYRRSYNANNRSVKRTRDQQKKAEAKAAVDKIKDAPCMDCGNRFPAVAMDFDHIGPKTKSVASMVSQGYKLKLILEEITKCEIVCACCHRLRTAKRKEYAAPHVPVAPYRAETLATMEGVVAVFDAEPGLIVTVDEIRKLLNGRHVAVKTLKQLVVGGRLVQLRRNRHCYCLPETARGLLVRSATADDVDLPLRLRILALLSTNAAGAFSSGEIIQHLGTDKSTTYTMIHRLLRHGELVRSEQGLYQAVETSAQEVGA